jgi:hypothetical protein
MTAPDEDPAIANLLEDAAQLATAANAKLSDALAIAGQTRRDEALMLTGVLPRQPGSQLRARLATAQEVKALHKSAWPEGWTLDPACFVWANIKIDSERTGIEVLFHILPVPKLEPRDDELERMWRNAERSIAGIERRTGQ